MLESSNVYRKILERLPFRKQSLIDLSDGAAHWLCDEASALDSYATTHACRSYQPRINETVGFGELHRHVRIISDWPDSIGLARGQDIRCNKRTAVGFQNFQPPLLFQVNPMHYNFGWGDGVHLSCPALMR